MIAVTDRVRVEGIIGLEGVPTVDGRLVRPGAIDLADGAALCVASPAADSWADVTPVGVLTRVVRTNIAAVEVLTGRNLEPGVSDPVFLWATGWIDGESPAAARLREGWTPCGMDLVDVAIKTRSWIRALVGDPDGETEIRRGKLNSVVIYDRIDMTPAWPAAGLRLVKEQDEQVQD